MLDWFSDTFSEGPTPAQRLAWPAVAQGRNVLLVSPTGTGKTLAAFLAILDTLHAEHAAGKLEPGLRCVYVSPLRSLGYDIERNLAQPLEAIRGRLGLEQGPVRVGVRTGDTSAYERRRQREAPPHLLITTPESLALLLSQPAWHPHWRGVGHLIVDEVHALVPTKRGADLAVSLERLSARAQVDPARLGLSATCRPPEPVARYLVGSDRPCDILVAPVPEGTPPVEIEVESLLKADEAPHRGLTYRRLLRRLARTIRHNRTTVVFANTRAFTEKITLDLRHTLAGTPIGPGSVDSESTAEETVAAHHSALDARRRQAVEGALKSGSLRAVVTSTSLELGVDIGTADQTVQIGLPGGVARLLQRIGRSGHRVGVASRGLILAATPAELAGGVVTAAAARAGRVEPLRSVSAPLDVLCQQLVGMACEGEWLCDDAFALVRRSAPMEHLTRADFDACLASLAGDLATPAGATEPEPRPGNAPRWTSPRLWRRAGLFGVRSSRVVRWFRANVGTITSEESVRVMAGGVEIGTLEGSFAERLQPGDRFVLDGRSFEYQRSDGRMIQVRDAGGDPSLPRWTSDRQSLTPELAAELSVFRVEAAARLADGPVALRAWLHETHDLDPESAALLVDLFETQERLSEIPGPDTLLVEEFPHDEGHVYAFHAPLGRAACEALGRGTAARLGRRWGRDLSLTVADLGWSVRLPDESLIELDDLPGLLALEGLTADILEGVDRGELPARQLSPHRDDGPDGPQRPREAGVEWAGQWVSTRLYPLVKAACPDHPLLRETARGARRPPRHAVGGSPGCRPHSPPAEAARRPSPFATAWIDLGASTASGPVADALRFRSPAAAAALHARLAVPESAGKSSTS
ncbi:MAG: DEAD/DEAH box helicase [Isosphaeraceae bacterium]